MFDAPWLEQGGKGDTGGASAEEGWGLALQRSLHIQAENPYNLLLLKRIVPNSKRRFQKLSVYFL